MGNYNEVDPEAIQAQIPGARCVSLQSKQKGIDKRFQAYAGQVLEAVQSIIRDNPKAKALIQIMVSSQGEGRLLAGLTGLLKTAQMENPKLVGQLLEVEGQEDLTGIVTKLRESSYRPQDSHIRYQAGKRLVATLTEIETPETPGIPWRKGGIYLITGGSGGLGLLFANEMTDQVKEITLIMTGRSPLSEERQKRLQALEAKGARVNYRQVDVTDKKAVMGLVQDIQAEFGGLHGIIHSAGVIHDSYIIKKTKAELEAVLGPKVSGVVNLDGATKDLDLDFVVYFSSIASQGSAGQADYAMANAFMNAYAGYRNTLVAANERHGRTVAINWPLWQEGGMHVDAATEQLMTQSTGMIPLRTTSGIKAFYQSLGSNEELAIVMEGNLTRMRQKMLGAPVGADVIPKKSGGRRPEMKGLTVSQCLEWDLKQLIYQLLKIPREKIERDANLEDFGFDSISLTEFATLLNRHYGIETITPAMFFGYSNIEKLIQYFLDEQQEIIGEFYREDGAESQAPVKEAVVAIRPKRQARRLITGNEKNGINGSEPVAVIGMSGRFPKARTIDEFWEILVQGKDAVEEIPAERFDWRQYYGDPMQGKTNCKWCGCISGVKEFEPLFFEISPREAECTDPRQRLLLQESWRALEDAGYGSEQLKSQKIGMFVGVERGDYQDLTNWEGGITSNSNAILAARLAYFLNLNGPVMAIDTACSSGLVAAHQAVLSLRAGECDTAIAAGVNLLLTPGPFIGMSQAGMLSQEGKCRSFDKGADGLVPGEAVVAVVLKRLSRAEADGDPIYAVIKGSGINYDGKTNGITAPNGIAQTALLKTVYDQYRINPETIEYIVTHGTGTKLGDPIEINALYDAFKGYTSRDGARKQGYCALTSTKTNIGHTMGASGLVSLVGLVQALRHETIPASLHCEQENDYINWQESPFYVNKANKGLARNGGKGSESGPERLARLG